METIVSQLPNREIFFRGNHDIETGCPWFTYGAIIAIEYLVKPTDKVLELGCGGSTIFWSRRCAEVKSYDLDLNWVRKVRNSLPLPSNVQFIWAERAKKLIQLVQKEPDGYYNWLICDIGNCYSFRRRILQASVSKLHEKGFLVIDNYAKRYISLFDYSKWGKVYTFDEINYSGKGTRICRR